MSGSFYYHRCRQQEKLNVKIQITKLTLVSPRSILRKMKNYVPRFCVFCGAYADSREHVFALCLCERAGAEKYPVVAGLSTDGKEPVTRNKSLIQNVTVRHVCTECNNDWMSKLETWFLSRLGFLIEPEWPKLASAMIQELKSERGKLAQWLMKTAITFSKASVQGEHPVNFPEDVTRKVKEGILPGNCWVDLAYSKSIPSIVGGFITRHFHVINGGQPRQDLVLKDGDGFMFVVQFNHLLLRIGQAPHADVTYISQRGERPIRLYPTPLLIPENYDYEYEDYVEFLHSVELVTGLGCRGNIR
jgi:hypothetical protein